MTGALKAVEYGLGPVPAALMGMVTAIGGGMMRDVLAGNVPVIFEGAQGVLLDEWQGFHPYTTWSTTTLANADRLLEEAGYTGARTRVGITRAYATRHGAGPLVTEEAELTRALPDPSNQFGAWQRGFRVGWLDLVMLQYALEAAGPLDQGAWLGRGEASHHRRRPRRGASEPSHR